MKESKAKSDDRLGTPDTEPSIKKTSTPAESPIVFGKRGAREGIAMMEAMYEADEASQLEENKSRLLSYVVERDGRLSGYVRHCA